MIRQTSCRIIRPDRDTPPIINQIHVLYHTQPKHRFGKEQQQQVSNGKRIRNSECAGPLRCSADSTVKAYADKSSGCAVGSNPAGRKLLMNNQASHQHINKKINHAPGQKREVRRTANGQQTDREQKERIGQCVEHH